MFGCNPAMKEEVQDMIFLRQGFFTSACSKAWTFPLQDRSHPGSKPSTQGLEQPQHHLSSVGGEGRMTAGIIH